MSFDRDWTVAPGDTLRELAQERNLSIAALARLCHIDAVTFEDIVNGTVAIIPEFADKIAAGTGTTARFWLNAERLYQEDLAAGRKRFE